MMLYVWGANYYDQLGLGNHLIPFKPTVNKFFKNKKIKEWHVDIMALNSKNGNLYRLQE